VKLKFQVTRTGKTVEQTTEAVTDRVEKAVAKTAHDFEVAAMLRCPVSGTTKAGPRQPKGLRLEAQMRVPGWLRASINGRSWKSGNKYYGSCGFFVKHGLFVEFGTAGPSATIRPIKKKALAWYGPGRAIITRKSSRGGPLVVGGPKKPRTSWNALKERRGRRQTMPFLRPAWYIDTLPKARRRFGRALKKTG